MCVAALHPPSAVSAGEVVVYEATQPRSLRGECWGPNRQGHAEEEDSAPQEEDPTATTPDLFRYPPPTALSELANVKSETIALVVQSSLHHVIQQVEAERQMTRGTEHAITTPNTSGQQINDDGSEAPSDIGSTEEQRSDAGQERTHGSTGVSLGDLAGEIQPEQSREQKRHRFGLRRILQHIVEKGESSTSFDLSQLPAHVHHISRTHPPATGTGSHPESSPSLLTQLVYKHIKPSSLELSPSVETVECVSCFDDIRLNESVKTPCHFYCKDCFQQLIATALETEAQWPPKCCLNVVPYRTITKHARSDLVKLYRAKDEEFRVPVEHRIYCSEPDCGEWIRKVDKANKTARCSKGHAMCLVCRRTPHPVNIACPQDRDRQIIDQLAEDEGWRRCIKCTVLVEHKDACHHMTCPCGAQFCYVCGAVWKTCGCTSVMLAAIKQRAAVRRREREEKKGEEAWLKNALRLIEQIERDERAREEQARAEEAARREEQRRHRAAERARREEGRQVALDVKYRELHDTLNKLNQLQKALLSCTQHRELEEASIQATAERDALARQRLENRELQTELEANVRDRELEWEGDYHVRVLYEKRLEEEYRAVLWNFWKGKVDGEDRADQAMRAYMAQNDERWKSWRRRRDGDLEKRRYDAEEELAVREELLYTTQQRIEDKVVQQQAERRQRHDAERRWFELAVAERARLLAEIQAVERESGGDENEEDGEFDLNFFDDSDSSST